MLIEVEGHGIEVFLCSLLSNSGMVLFRINILKSMLFN
jgi:hypothetical protein